MKGSTGKKVNRSTSGKNNLDRRVKKPAAMSGKSGMVYSKGKYPA